MENGRRKLTILVLYDALKRETDEEHPLSGAELCRMLEEKGCPCGRKALYGEIAALRDYGADILYTRRPKPGFFLAEREFEVPEVRLLTDAVLTAPFITRRKTEELTAKLSGLLSRAQSGQMTVFLPEKNRVKFENEEIYYAIDAISRAILQKKKVSFVYHHSIFSSGAVAQNTGRAFVVSPYALLWNADRYYLAGNYEKYDSVSVFRLDRMKRAETLEAKARPFEEVSDYRGSFDAADFARRTFGMYHGEKQKVVLRCTLDLLETVLDKFGSDVPLEQAGGDSFTVTAEVYAGEGFAEWVLQYGGRVRVLSPEPLRQEIVRRIREMSLVYGLSEKTCDQ